MRLKKPNETPGNGGFLFEFEDKEGKTQQVKSNGISQLTEKAKVVLQKNGIPVPPNLAQIVEHQICARQTFPAEDCWMGGIGDELHQKWAKPFLEATAKAVEKRGRLGRAIARVARKIKNCGGCGGTKVYSERQAPLGRAGVLNKLTGNRVFERVKH